jgi:hypothetical protein
LTTQAIDRENDDFEAADRILPQEGELSEEKKYAFNWRNLWIASLTQALPQVLGLVLVSYAFKFALMAQMNQGSIPGLFSVTSIYISILFYMVFGETISCTKIMGILLMMPCVILLSLDKKVVNEDSDYSERQLVEFGSYAVIMGVLAPVFWTFKVYWTRRTINDKTYDLKDLALDTVLFKTFF